MIQQVLSSIGGVGNYGVIAVVLFVVVFAGVLVWTFGLRRPYLDHMSHLPLEVDPADGVVTTDNLTSPNRHD
jgi:hypothetical protein